MPSYYFVLSIPPGSSGNFSVFWLTSTMTMYKEVIMLLANDPDHLRSLWSLVTGGFFCSFDLILKETLTFKTCKISVEKLLLSTCIVSEFCKPASCKKNLIQWAQKQYLYCHALVIVGVDIFKAWSEAEILMLRWWVMREFQRCVLISYTVDGFMASFLMDEKQLRCC